MVEGGRPVPKLCDWLMILETKQCRFYVGIGVMNWANW